MFYWRFAKRFENFTALQIHCWIYLNCPFILPEQIIIIVVICEVVSRMRCNRAIRLVCNRIKRAPIITRIKIKDIFWLLTIGLPALSSSLVRVIKLSLYDGRYKSELCYVSLECISVICYLYSTLFVENDSKKATNNNNNNNRQTDRQLWRSSRRSQQQWPTHQSLVKVTLNNRVRV